MSDFDRLMSDSLKGIRNEHLKQIEAEVPVARRQLQEKLSGRRFRFVVGGVAVAAAALAVALFVTQTLPRLDRSSPIRPAGEPVVIARIDVPGVGAMGAGLDRLWVAHEEGLSGIDPATSTIATESPTKGVEDMALNSEAMYAINTGDRSISRIPFGTNEAAFAIQIEGTPTAITASDEAVWVAAAVGPVGDFQIMKMSPDLEPIQSGAESSIGSDHTIADMTFAEGALWITADRPGAGFVVERIDGTSGMGWELVEEEGSVADVVADSGGAWVLRQANQGGGNTITRLDPQDGDQIERAVSFEDSIESIAVGEGYLWVTTAPTRMNMPDDVRASLHRIDPQTLEEVGAPLEVSGPGSKLAVGYGYVWVGDPNNSQIVQIDPHGKASPEPEESTPAPEETETSQDPPKCRTFLPFASSDGSLTLEIGSGGQRDTALRDQSPAALVHFSHSDGAFMDVVTGEPAWPPTEEEQIRVLGTQGSLHAIEDGYAVTFGLGGCRFQLGAHGFNENEVRDFVQTLGLRGHLDAAQDAFTIWPGEAPEAAYATCVEAQGSQLGDARATALAFAENALRWDEAEIDESAGFILNAKSGLEGYHVLREGAEGSPRVLVMLREVARDCWHVNSVRPANYDPADEETGLSISHRDGETTVAFDLEREAAGHRVESVRLIVAPGQVLLSSEEFERKGFIRLTDRRVERPKALLVLLLDENDRVVGAIGQPLPSGDFSAG